ncbi:MAG: uridine kinase family protein, partial [Planctomycetota bacterium]
MHKNKTHVEALQSGRALRSAAEIIAGLLIKKFTGFERPVVIAVGGPGGIGKSSFCLRLKNHLNNCAVLHLDDYKTPRAVRSSQNLFGAHPDANYMDLIEKHIRTVRHNTSFDKPVYDSVDGTADRVEPFTPQQFTLLDGEISTYSHFKELVDFSIFIDADWTTQLQTRINRDIDERGYSKDKAIATFLQSNLREFTEHGAESKNWADIHL